MKSPWRLELKSLAPKEDIFCALLEDLLLSETTAYHHLQEQMKKDEPKTNLRMLFILYCKRQMTTGEALHWKRVTFFPPAQFKEVIEEKFFEFENVVTEILSAIYKDAKAADILRNVDGEVFAASFFCLADGIFLEHHYYHEQVFRQRMDAVWKVYNLGIFKAEGE
ncbi:hypothetical protein ACQ0QQ_18275 [Lysinibacillus sphaericus]